MGVGGQFWELVKPYGRMEGHDHLREKRVAVDLSLWIIQNEIAVINNKGGVVVVRNPHLRLLFFRTINLFSKFGAFPVFVTDGTPSPLKAQARIIRYFRASGVDLSNLPPIMADDGTSRERNLAFRKCVQECVELLGLLGMPVLNAKGEAEALCAQLNHDGQVDACITSDSDALLFGADCIIKSIRPNSKEPFECYYMSDIEAGLGLKRNHLIAISLLVGNDHDLKGVHGVGIDTALRFVKSFSADEVLTRLTEIGKGETLQFGLRLAVDDSLICNEPSPRKRSPHCSFCGHPGSKKAHLNLSCEYCNSTTSNGCIQKPIGYKCDCNSCVSDRRDKEKKKGEDWHIKVCQKKFMEHDFPNAEIIKIYLNNDNFDFSGEDPQLVWEMPKPEMLVDYMGFYLNWEPSYIRQRIVPMLSTNFLREIASNPNEKLLYGQYEFDSIQRVKTRFGHQILIVNWKKNTPASDNIIYIAADDESENQQESSEQLECNDTFDEADLAPQMCLRDGCWYLTTEENMDLVKHAFPEKFDQFFREKELKERKLKRKKSLGTPQSVEASTSSKSVQLSITEFYRASKLLCKSKSKDDLTEIPQNSTDSSEGKSSASKLLCKSKSKDDFTEIPQNSTDSSEGKSSASKLLCKSKSKDDLTEIPQNSTVSSEGKSTTSSSKISKSVRRRLLFG